MIEMYDLTPAACVDRGIDFLDELGDDWDTQIVLAELDLGMACSCVCGFRFRDEAKTSSKTIFPGTRGEQLAPTGYDYAVLTYGVDFKVDWSRVPDRVKNIFAQNIKISPELQFWPAYLGFDSLPGFNEYDELQTLWVQVIARRQVERLQMQEREREMVLV